LAGKIDLETEDGGVNSPRRFSRWVFLIVIAVSIAVEVTAIFSSSVKAQTQSTPSDDQVNAIASQIYCPVCQNITLDVCDTQACAQWRDLIRQQLAQGQSADQIKQYFVQQYGDRVLAVPPRSGFNWVLYVLPPAILIVAVLLTANFFRSHQAATLPQDQAKDEQDD
jgi:cytochrome c-type biogenesis protein CcmH